MLGTDNLWGRFGVLGLPGWKTISADGETRSGAGALPSDVLAGDWTS